MVSLQQDIRRCPRVAVYGTLKRGQHNHHWLEAARLLGRDRLGELTLYDLGAYPGAKRRASSGVLVEVYVIGVRQLASLDRLEDHRAHAPSQGLYRRVVLPTRHGAAWCYLYNPEVAAAPRLTHGCWPG